MSAVSQASERFTFRLDPEKKQAIERAAGVRGLSLTQFAIMTLYREAQEVLRTEHVVVLSDADRDAFLEALDNPPVPTEKAIKAAKRYKAARKKGETAGWAAVLGNAEIPNAHFPSWLPRRGK